MFKKFLYVKKRKSSKKFLIFRETETLKSFTYFSEGNFSAQAQKTNKKQKHPKKKLLYFGKWNSALFSPSSKNKIIHFKRISYTSANGNPEKIPYISGNFLYLRK